MRAIRTYSGIVDGFPYLDLRSVPSGLRTIASVQFILSVCRFVGQHGVVGSRSFVFKTWDSQPIGYSDGSLMLRATARTVLRAGPLIIALEDKRFLRHRGIDYRATLRALLKNLSRLGVRQGGSTLTQQLVRNVFVYPTRARGCVGMFATPDAHESAS
jgi:hypothetical protein